MATPISLTFETGTLSDAVQKANKIAPSRGKAFDSAGGILVELNYEESGDPIVLIRSTDTNVYLTQWIRPVEASGDAGVWRLPSTILASILQNLPMGSGRQVSLTETPSGLSAFVRLVSGRTKARLNMLDPSYYPRWGIFDPADMSPVEDLGAAIALVEWAADDSGIPFCGIHFTGESVICTDRYKMAVVPLKVEALSHPVTVPKGLLSSVVRSSGLTYVRATDQQLLLMPDESTQLRVTIYDTPFPSVTRSLKRDHECHTTFSKEAFLAMLARVAPAAASDRMPTLELYVGEGEIAAMMRGQDANMIGDAIEVSGAAHERVKFRLTPKSIEGAVGKARGESVTLGYNTSNPDGQLLHIAGSGSEAWIITRKDVITR